MVFLVMSHALSEYPTAGTFICSANDQTTFIHNCTYNPFSNLGRRIFEVNGFSDFPFLLALDPSFMWLRSAQKFRETPILGETDHINWRRRYRKSFKGSSIILLTSSIST
jgi:hypothetical protein